MSYFGKDFDRMMGFLLFLAVIGFVVLCVGIPLALSWLWQHVRFA